MSGLILVVDRDVEALAAERAFLQQSFVECLTATSEQEASVMARAQKPDLIVLNTAGIPLSLCRTLKSDPLTSHIPLIIVSPMGGEDDRIQGLEAGADDYLVMPLHQMTLLARVRSLVRLKRIIDEWRVRQDMLDQFTGAKGEDLLAAALNIAGARILAIDCDAEMQDIFANYYRGDGYVLEYITTPIDNIRDLFKTPYDMILFGMGDDVAQSLRLCSSLRGMEATRNTPIMLVIRRGHEEITPQALEIGINDYVIYPPNPDELRARTRTLLRRQKYQRALTQSYEKSLALALTDPLTGLYNRRYVLSHLDNIMGRGHSKLDRDISVLMIDIDYFKTINDTYGHATGDAVLRDVAERLQNSLRNFDLVARIGGEEFLCVLPDASKETAERTANRLREVVEKTPFFGSDPSKMLSVTVSVGVAYSNPSLATPESLLDQADKALYAAKAAGRNCVKSSF